MHEQPNPHNCSEAADAAQGGTPQAAHQPPPGGRLLTADEAVDFLITGDHPDSARGTLAFDAALVEALRAGWLLACRMPDGQIAFTRVAEDSTGLTPPA